LHRNTIENIEMENMLTFFRFLMSFVGLDYSNFLIIPTLFIFNNVLRNYIL